MSKRISLISNLTIAVVLLVLSLAVFTTDLSEIYLTVSAPLYNGNKSQKNISIMINVYSGTEYIEPIMEALASKGVNATFFLGGTWATQNAKLVKDISLRFELGNHAYNHKDLKKMSITAQKAEIQNTHTLIKGITGIDMNLFAPPSGSFSKNTLKAAEELGYTTIMWSVDTVSWSSNTTKEQIIERATKDPKNGDLVLMQPSKNTLEALPDIIDYYLTQGFNVVAVSQNIA